MACRRMEDPPRPSPWTWQLRRHRMQGQVRGTTSLLRVVAAPTPWNGREAFGNDVLMPPTETTQVREAFGYGVLMTEMLPADVPGTSATNRNRARHNSKW